MLHPPWKVPGHALTLGLLDLHQLTLPLARPTDGRASLVKTLVDRFDRTLELLLVEDNPADAGLTREGFRQSGVPIRLTVIVDGVSALQYLRKQFPYSEAVRPDLILLDLNLPEKDGREVLVELKADPSLRKIPVVILTTSSAESDLQAAYESHANCYLRKPSELDPFIELIRLLGDFWFTVARLPARAPFN